jgi:hypothetical protein
MRYAINIEETIKVFNQLPKKWQGINGFQYIENPEDYGFYPIENDPIPEGKKRGQLYFTGNSYKYEFVDLTDAEIDAKIPTEMPALAFKIAIKDLGLTDTQVSDAIDIALQNGMITEAEHYETKLKWDKMTIMMRKDPMVDSLLPLVNTIYSLNITKTDIDDIFKNYTGI